MNAAAIVYTSQTGFTARYAALLAERTGLPCRPLKEAAALPRGTAVIYLGWLCAGGIKGLKGARRRFRTAAVCAVGMAAEVEEAKLRRDNRLEGVPLFYLRGGYAPEKLTGFYRAMMAPIDVYKRQDFASCVLAQQVNADTLIILTAVEKVAINFGKPNQTWLDSLTPAEAKVYMERGHFAPGSMLPKVQAAVEFAESAPGRTALITLLEKAKDGVAGRTGTVIHQ